MWVSFAEEPIALYFYLRSHHVSRLVNQFFVHYGPLWAEYKDTHPASTEEDFKPIWAVFVEEHVQAELKRLGIQVQPEAVLHSVEPYGGAMWHGLLGHGGTSQEGLRGFALLLKAEDQDKVELPQSSIELWRASPIYAGVMDVILRPLEVALASKHAVDVISKFFARAANAEKTRLELSKVQEAIQRVMDKVRREDGVRPILNHVGNLKPVDSSESKPEPVMLLVRHSTTFYGLVCNAVGRRRVVLWLELKSGDPTKGALFRGAAFAQELISSQDRRAPEASRALSCFLTPCHPVTTTVAFSSGGNVYNLLYSPVLMEGEPLSHRLHRDLEQWRNHRELTEDLRHSLLGLSRTVDRLEDYGFRPVTMDLSLFCIDAHDRVKLMFAGGGFIGQKKRPQCNRQPHQGALPLIRRNTSWEQDYRARMNMRSPDVIRRQRPSQLEATAACREWSDTDLRTWSSARRGKPMGVLGRWNAEFSDLVADDHLIEDLESAKEADQIMALLRLTDVHQIMVWLVCELREASRKCETWAARRPMLVTILKSDSMEDFIQGMQLFVLGGNPIRAKLARDADSQPLLPCNQPAAFKRLLEMVSFSLHPAYREHSSKELSYMLFLTTAVFNPGDELQLRGEGIRMEVRLYPFDDPGFIRDVDEMFKKKGTKGLHKFPRTMLLKNEEEYGVGVFGPDEYKKGDFLGFYMGTVEDEPHGRHVLTSTGSGKAKYCNGGFSRFLPVSAHRKRGTPGPFMNSSQGRFNKDGSPLRPNAKADRKHQVLHTHAGRRMTCIPLFASCDFAKAFIVWDYDPEAGHGVSFASCQ
jgi:hypothetical protein